MGKGRETFAGETSKFLQIKKGQLMDAGFEFFSNLGGLACAETIQVFYWNGTSLDEPWILHEGLQQAKVAESNYLCLSIVC